MANAKQHSKAFRFDDETLCQIEFLAQRWGHDKPNVSAIIVRSIERTYQQEISMTHYHFRVTSYQNAQQPPHDKPTRFMFAVEDTETGGIVHEEQEFLSYSAALDAARDYMTTLRQS